MKNLIILITLSLSMLSCTSHKEMSSGSLSTQFADPKIEHKVDSLLAIMTLEEKIGQLVLYTSNFDVTGPSTPIETTGFIKAGQVGAIFNAFTASHNRELQRLAVEESRLGIPLVFGYDIIHGFKTIFPINLGMAATWDSTLIQRTARVAAEEGTAAGLQWTFSPMVDLTRDPRWGRVSEGSGEDAYLGAKIGAAMVRGYQGEDLSADNTLLACVKHFAGYGAPQAGRDYHTVDISDRTLREVYLPAYKATLEAGAGSIMTAFNDIDGTPATASEYLFTDILRKDWGFRGFVVTDYTAIMELMPHGVAKDSLDATVKAINAGVNMDMESGFYHKYLSEAVNKGLVSQNQVDQMCREVLRIKFYLGLFDDPYKYMDEQREKTAYLKPEYLDLSREVAAKSCVLLQNDKNTLPIHLGERIAVIGPLADSRTDLLGSWRAAGDYSGIPSILDAIKERFSEKNVSYSKGCELMGSDKSGFALAINAAKAADVVILVVGESWEWTGEAASSTELTLTPIQQALVNAIHSTGKPVVMVLMSGRPMELTDIVGKVHSVLMAWYPGTNGARGVVDVISGDYNPSGKITMTFPRRVGQVPIHYDMKNTGRPVTEQNAGQKYISRYLFTPNEPLYPFGYGMSYTTFEYSDLIVSSPKVKVGDTPINISVKIKNTGARAGVETAQLYVRDLVASVTRPVRQLKGFKKVSLAAGESKTLNFTLTQDELAFYREDMSLALELGGYDLWLGTDSTAPLMGSFEIIP